MANSDVIKIGSPEIVIQISLLEYSEVIEYAVYHT